MAINVEATETIELEVWQDEEGMWLINVDGVSVAKSFFQKPVRDLVKNVIEYNPDVKFSVIG
ncbi:hypothetical protein [Sporosarcina sp. 6E9]|uniref:hypothetical protein n=1 Tax=Sporosarcina sp. 6E9 TaxID=2819235 RepID=UPI001AD18746|nr:hypothetical protein [Sporosarcina sp. 6E9]MBO1909722.1 hypothetical protein [Microvirga sp. 3-52]